MTATELTQLLAGITTLVAGLGGVAAFVASRLSRRQREQADEIRNLREYAALVSKWGFQVRLILIRNGIEAPAMPELFAEDEPDEAAPTDRQEPEPAAAQPRPAERRAGDIHPTTWPAAHPGSVGNLGPERRDDDEQPRGRHVLDTHPGLPRTPGRSIGGPRTRAADPEDPGGPPTQPEARQAPAT